MTLLLAAEQRRQRRRQADLAEAIAMAYSGSRSKEGHQALLRYLAALRRD